MSDKRPAAFWISVASLVFALAVTSAGALITYGSLGQRVTHGEAGHARLEQRVDRIERDVAAQGRDAASLTAKLDSIAGDIAEIKRMLRGRPR